jgi:hypothetical protein
MIDQNTTPIVDTSKHYVLLYHPKWYSTADRKYHRLLWIMDEEYYRECSPEKTTSAEMIFTNNTFYDAMKCAIDYIGCCGKWTKDVSILVNDIAILDCVYKPSPEQTENVL